MHFLATCTPWVERLVRSELERQNIQITYGQDRLIGFSGDMMTMTTANIWSRTANRIYIELDKIVLTSFDGLFACIESIDWSQWIPGNTPINVSATSIRSALSNTPTIQSVTKKAIIRRLSNGEDEWHENMLHQPIEIFILVVADEVHILINTSWHALHKRGYRTLAGEAPIKESLGAAMILLSGWKYATPFYDPMCGSGTIPIEAAMIARNIAPWLQRDFDFLHFPCYDKALHTETLQEARKKVFKQSYQIFGSDIDPEMIAISQENARRAGVADTITFSVASLTDIQYPEWAHLVTNPPYGNRLESDDLDGLYTDLENIFIQNHLSGGGITTYEPFPRKRDSWTKMNLMNGGDKCQFWRKAK